MSDGKALDDATAFVISAFKNRTLAVARREGSEVVGFWVERNVETQFCDGEMEKVEVI